MGRSFEHLSIASISGRPQWSVKCSGCGVIGSVPSSAPPESAKKALERQGWEFRTTEKIFCQKCVKAKKGTSTMSAAPVRPTAPVLAAVPTPSPAASPVVPRQLTADEKRRVRELLLTHFDDETGRYTIGWDDARISKESNSPATSVSEFREYAFGPLRPDPELASIKSEIDKMLGRLAELSDRVSKIEGR